VGQSAQPLKYNQVLLLLWALLSNMNSILLKWFVCIKVGNLSLTPSHKIISQNQLSKVMFIFTYIL